MKYETLPIYIAIHVLVGMIAYFYPILILPIIVYQLVQFTLNCRFFVFSWKIEKGNSASYTLYKIMQYVLGYCAAYVGVQLYDLMRPSYPTSKTLSI